MPIYDEYENEYLDVVPKKSAINFLNSRHVSEENMTVIQSQRAEKERIMRALKVIVYLCVILHLN